MPFEGEVARLEVDVACDDWVPKRTKKRGEEGERTQRSNKSVVEMDGFVSHVKANDLEAVRKALAAGADVDQLASQWSEPNEKRGIHYAAYNGAKDMVDLLIRHGADVNRKERDSYTPLHYAVFFRHYDVVERLVEAGADPNEPDGEGRTPLERARSTQDARMEHLLTSKDRTTAASSTGASVDP